MTVYNECHAVFGDKWFASHRNGMSGFNNPNTQDIQVRPLVEMEAPVVLLSASCRTSSPLGNGRTTTLEAT